MLFRDTGTSGIVRGRIPAGQQGEGKAASYIPTVDSERGMIGGNYVEL